MQRSAWDIKNSFLLDLINVTDYISIILLYLTYYYQQAIGHGMSTSYLDKVREVAKQFFALPVEEKQRYARAVNESEGYGNDRIVSEKQVLDWSYRLTLRVFPKEQRRLSLWPENPTDFRHYPFLMLKFNCVLNSLAPIPLHPFHSEVVSEMNLHILTMFTSYTLYLSLLACP